MTEASALGHNLRLGRLYRGKTLVDVGRAVGCERQYILQLESSARNPSEELLRAIADFLDLSPAFFRQSSGPIVRSEDCHFRKRKTTPKKIMQQVAAHATLFARLMRVLDSHLGLPKLNVPTMAAGEDLADVEAAAMKARQHWDIATSVPIKSVTRVLERAGVPIATFSSISEKVDAFSWCRKEALVVRSTDKRSASRSRFDLAHELGHLVMHRGPRGDADLELQADRFASAFLFPKEALFREWPGGNHWTWAPIFKLKRRWGISVAAIVRRAFDLGIINGLRYRNAYIHISREGWRKGEPQEEEPEVSTLLPKAFKLCKEHYGKTPEDIAAECSLRTSDLPSLTGLALDALRN